jgi:hypothetical protein
MSLKGLSLFLNNDLLKILKYFFISLYVVTKFFSESLISLKILFFILILYSSFILIFFHHVINKTLKYPKQDDGYLRLNSKKATKLYRGLNSFLALNYSV